MMNLTCKKHFSAWLVLLVFAAIGLATTAHAQNSAVVRSGAGNSSLTVQQLGVQANTLRTRNTNQQTTMTANEAEMQSIENDTAVQQTRIDDLNTTLTQPAPAGEDMDNRAADAKTEAQDIEPHAKATIPSPGCAAGQKLYWNGSAWACVTELDKTVGIHANTSHVPPACALDEKTIWDVPTNSWSCAAELTVTGPAGPQGPDGPAGADGIDGGGIWQYGTGGKIYYNAGLIGIGGGVESGMKLKVTGTATIDGNLDVGGAIVPGNTASCTAAIEGGMRYNSGNGEVEVCVNNTWQGISVNGSGLCIPPGSCQTPWATWISNGQTVTAYQSTSVPYGSSCASISQNRTCTSGTLSGSYNFASCTVQPPANCGLPWGGSIGHGATVTAYQSSSVSCLNSCTSQTRTCNNGTLSGSYTNQSCTVNACNSCARPWGGTVAHGGSITAYASAAPACGTACTSQTRTCSDGTLSGSYTNASCSTKCCLPWGGSINSGSSTTAYQSSSVACGNSCVSQTRSCSGTTLSGSYTNGSCSVGGCASCSKPWGGTVAHGSSTTAYAASSVPCGSSCSSQTRTCNNGSLSGSYNYGSCSVAGCASCTLDGATVASGSSRTFYLSSRSCGATCGSISQSRTCSNGSLSGSGSYSKASCPAESCASCARPWGGTVAHGGSITAYAAASVACGSSCTSQSRSCNNGTLSGSYTNQSCSVGSCNCVTGGGVSIANGSCAYLFNKQFALACHGGCGYGQNCCTNGTLSAPIYRFDDCTEEPCCGGVPC